MADMLAQVRLARTTGLPEDLVVNTFTFKTAGVQTIAEAASGIRDRISRFYNDPVAPQPVSLASRLSDTISKATDAHEIRFYDQNAIGAQIPLATRRFSIPFTASTAIPAEVSLVLTMRANLNGVPPARQRGRLYLGPFGQAALRLDEAAGEVRPEPATLDAILRAGLRLITEADATMPKWAVWSGRDNLARLVDRVAVDDAWDTQRRRGVKPTLRTTLVAPGA